MEDENNIDVNLLAEQFAKEKNDIVCGFLKEKQIIEIIHKEEVNDIVAKYEQEKECIRREFELEKEDLLQGFQTQQVEKLNAFQREQEKLESKTAKKSQSRERNIEMKYKEERLKIRQEYEEIIAEKNEEIKILRRELLRVEHQENRVVRHSPDNDFYITRMKSDEELRRLAEEFETEKSELERKFDRVKAQLVQDFLNQTERMNANFEHVKQRMQEDHKKELEFKVAITEKLLSEKSDLDKKRILQQFEREITELQESLEMDFSEKLLEKQQTIDNLEKDKRELLNALQNERFSLAKVYNREMSLLTKPDQLTKEDVEVALIDETAKLKKQYEDALIQMEAQHKQKIEVVKRNQRPMRELELQHRREIEELKKDFANEKERVEAGFRKEQFNLLKSFEFEKNDLEQRYEEIINERELEIQQREDDIKRLYEDELDGLKSIVAKQREELEVAKQKLTDLADQTEEFLSEKNRIEEKFLKENNKCQSLEQAVETNIRTYEKNMKEVETFYQKELAKMAEEQTREEGQLRNIETEKLDLQKEIEALKAKLERFQMASENAIEANGEVVLESCLVDKNAGAKSEEITGADESKLTGTKSSLDKKKEEEEKEQETQREENEEENHSLRVESKEVAAVDDSKPTGTKSPLYERKEKEKKEKDTLRQENEEVNECLRKVRERLKMCMPEGEQQPKTLEEFQMSNKQMKDAINQEIVEIDKFCGNKETAGEDVILLGEEPLFSLEDQLQAVNDILTEEDLEGNIDKSTKGKINEKMKEVLKKAQRLHEFEKLKLKKEQQEKISKILKELAEEKTVKVQKSMEDLKYLQDTNKGGDRSPRCIESNATEERGTSTDDLHHTKEGQGPLGPFNMVEGLRREKEEMKRSIDELEKNFAKEKEELMEKLQTQHKEFVMSTEGEIIENILKQKSALEEAFNSERFYLSRLYYLEMKEELEDILSRKKEKLKREFNRDKMNIIFKYESDIADLQKLLSEKDEMEIRLLQDRSDATGKLLAAHKKGTQEKDSRKRRKEKDRLEREKENLEVAIPLKKEIAELQSKRHQEHETAVANLKEAIDLIKDIMTNTPSITSVDDQQFDRLSFLSEDPMRSTVLSPVGKSSEIGFKSRKRDLLSEEEIRNRDDLKDALENLVEVVLNEDDEKSVYDSDTTSGASSDLESEDLGPKTVNGDSDEGAYSGPESTDSDMLNIKKAQLDFVFNLERFNLGRVYYGEYRDSLRKAMKKIAKAKEALRSKRKDVENEMLSGIQTLVNRTHFAEELAQASKRDIETQTAEETDTFEDRAKGFVDGQQLPKSKKADNEGEPSAEVGDVPDDSQEDLESDQEEKKKAKSQEKEKRLQETPAKSSGGNHSSSDENLTVENEVQEDVNAEGHGCQDDRYTEHDDKYSSVTSERELQAEKSKDNVLHGLGQDVDNTEKDEEEQAKKERGEGEKDETYRNSEDKPSDDRHTKHDSKEYTDGVCHAPGQDFGTIEEDEGDEQEESGKLDVAFHDTKNGEVKGFSEKESGSVEESKDKDSPLEEQDMQIPAEDKAGTSCATEGRRGDETKGIKENNAEKDTKEDKLEKTEDVDDMEAIEADDGISSEDITKDKPNEEKNECVEDQSTDDKAAMEAEESVEDAGDTVDIDRISSYYKTQEQSDTDKKRCEKDRTSDRDEDKDTKRQRQAEDGAVATCVMEDRKGDETKGIKENNAGKDSKEDRLKKMEDLDEMELIEAELATEVLTSEDEKEIEDTNSKRKKKEKKKEKKRKERKADKHTKENSSEESRDLSESEEKEDIAENDGFSKKSDYYFRTKDEEKDKSSFQQSESPVSEKDLIKRLNRNNKILQDKFNLLRELVGKGFVNEIPELSDDLKRKVPDAALENLSDLYAEKEQLGNELKEIDAKMTELARSGNDNLRDLNKQLEDEEAEILHSLEEIDKHLKKSNDEELVEHLLKEKEDVCTKLDEINNILNEKKDEMADLGSSDVETVPGLMYKRDVLKDDLIEKARELNYKNKMLEKTSKESEKERENLKNALNSLKVQLAALEDSVDNINDSYSSRAKEINKQLPPEIGSLLASKADDEHKRGKLGKEIKKTEKELERYERMLEEQNNRLKPFQRKKARLEESLKLVNQAGIEAEELTSKVVDEVTYDVKDPADESENAGLLSGNRTNVRDEDGSRSQRKQEIENQIKELNAAISNIELVTDDIPIAEKLEIVHQAKINKGQDLKRLEAEIVEEQNKLRKDGFDDSIQLSEHLEENEKLKREIAKLNNSQLDMASSRTEKGYPDVKKLQSLVLLKESLKGKIHKLDDGICKEQSNFLVALEFKRTGKCNADAESRIKELIDTKDKLVTYLKNTNETILQSLSTGGLTGPQAELIEECVERKVKLEEEVDKLQDEIDDETSRAAEKLADLLERKTIANEELINTIENAKDEVKRVQVNLCNDVEYNTDIPEEMNEIISQVLLILGQESTIIPEIEEYRQKQNGVEEIVKDKAERVTKAKRRGQDSSDEEEEALELIIREKICVDNKLQEVLVDEEDGGMEKKGESDNTTEGNTRETRSKENETQDIFGREGSERALYISRIPLQGNGNQSLECGNLDEDLNERRRELEEHLRLNEHRLHSLMQNAGLSDDLKKNDLDKLIALAKEKVKLIEELQNSQLLEDLFSKKQTLQEQLCVDHGNGDGRERKEQIESGLERLNTIIERREYEIKKLQTKKNAKEQKVKQLSNKKEELDDKLNPLKENIIEAKKKVKENLEEAQTNLNEYEKYAIEERQALRQELEVLQDDIERCNKEKKEVEKKLQRLKKELRGTNGDVLDLEKLLIEKESLSEYLIEIDATLDDSKRDTIEQETAEEIEKFTEKKKELEIKLEEIRNEKEKMDIEFEQEEMDEAVKELAQLKKDLETRERWVSDQIIDSGVLGKLAEKRKQHKRKMPRDFIQGILNSMARDEKTLTELLKEQEALKNAAQRQRDNLNDTFALVKSKVGEDLVNALTSSPKEGEEIQPDKESQYRSAIDEVEGKEVTVSDILQELGEENEQLRVINDELSSDLETLKDKIGEELVNEMLSQSLPIKHLEFADVVSAVQNDEQTLGTILHEQKDKLRTIEDTVGKGLFSSILGKEEKPDTKSDAGAATKLMAPSIMRTFDEDLENVIAVYEKELDNLSHENNILKEKLGEDLAKELLSLSKSNEKPRKDGEDQDEGRFEVNEPLTYVKDKGITPPLEVQEGLPLSRQEEGVDKDNTVKVTDQQPDEKATDNMESQDSLKMETSEQKDSKDNKIDRSSRSEGQQDTLPIKEQQMEDEDHGEGTETVPRQVETEIAPRLYNICSSYFSSPQEKSSSVLTDEEDFKGCLNAPKIMQDSGNTLGEIIAQYERDLQGSPYQTTPITHKASDSRIRGNLSDSRKPDDISGVDLTMQGIVEAQDKNMEMLRILKERLGEDLVDALTNKTEEDHSDDLSTDGKHDDLGHLENEGQSETQNDKERHMEEATFTEPGKEPSKESLEKEMRQDSSDNVSSRKMPDALIDDPAGESVQTNHQEEEKAVKRKIRAPNIALENKKTLGDVIASYEKVLDSLQSKLGPSLTRILLAMEDPTAMEHEDKQNQEKTKKIKEEISNKDDAQENEKLPVDEVVFGPAKEIAESSMASPELPSDERESSIGKPLSAPDIMATSGKTLEEIIEDYEQRINGELQQMEKEVNNLKEKLGNDLYDTLLNQSNRDGAVVHAGGVRSSTEEMTGHTYPEVSNWESVKDEGDLSPDDLKAKSLLQHEGKTVEDILRSYERQLEELSKLVPNESGESDSILDLISNYEDKIADLARTNKTFSDRMANLAECIGPDLMDKLESMETEGEETIDGVEKDDGIKAPMMMKTEDKTLEKVVRNYEKELDALRKMLPRQGDAERPISDVIEDYEDKINDLKSRSKCLEEEHDRLVSRIGHGLVDDILALKSAKDESHDDHVDLSDIESPTKTDANKFKDLDRLNAPIIMDKEDSTLENVLEIYEKALGLLPRPQGQDDSFANNKIQTFDELQRANKILKDALGDELAARIIANKDETIPPIPEPSERSEKIEIDEIKLSSQEIENVERPKLPLQEQEKDDIPVSEDENDQLKALELITDEGQTIETILKNYEEELEELRKLFPGNTNEGASVSDLVKGYEDRIEKTEKEKKTLSDMLSHLAKTIGPGLMDDLQNLNTNNKENEDEHMDDDKRSDLKAPNLMYAEKRTLEGVVTMYENELDALRKLVRGQGDEASSISDIIKDYEDKLRKLAEENKHVKDELRKLQVKIGNSLVDDLNKSELVKAEENESTDEANEKGTEIVMKNIVKLKAPDLMNEKKLPLEDILAVYEEDLCNLKRVNKIYEKGLGQGMADALLKLDKEKESSSPDGFKNQESSTQVLDNKDSEPTSKQNGRFEDEAIKQTKSTIGATEEKYEHLKQPHQTDAKDEAKSDTSAGTDGLKAINLLRDEGNDLEKILEVYEKEIEALKKLAPGESEEGISVSDLIKDYEDRIKDLESKQAMSVDKLNNLEQRIGEDLFYALEKLQSKEKEPDEEDSPSDKEFDLNAVNVMTNEDRTLENVVESYEKELSALRKILPGQEDESSSLSDIIKEYENKIENIKRQNEDLKSDLDVLENKLGSNLLDNLKTACSEKSNGGPEGSKENVDDSVVLEKLRAPEIMNENDLTLENVIASYEKDLDNLAKENKVLKENLGQRLVKALLNTGDKKEGLAITDYDGHSDTGEVGKDLMPLHPLRKGITKGSGEQKVEADSTEEETKKNNQPFDRNNNDEVEASAAVFPHVLKAESLITDEGRTIENILKNYEKQLEAVTKLAPGNEGDPILGLVTKYEDAIGGLEKENDNLARRLENLEKKIGTKLLNEVENREPEGATPLQENSDQDDDDSLMASKIMEEEERTLENVVKTYEKELDVLRNLIPSEDGEGNTITDMVKTYEDKIDQLKTENESLKDDSERLHNMIGHDLVNDIKKLEEIAVVKTEREELETSKPVKDLKVTKIMDVKRSTLEDVLETYESALGMLLSDTSNSTDELNCDIFYDQSSAIKELKEENDILKSTVGPALSETLLNIAKGGAKSKSDDTQDEVQVSEKDTYADDEHASIKELEKAQQHPIGAQKDSQKDSKTRKEGLMAEGFVREEGKTIENILNYYEKELEALKGQIVFLEGKIGADLINDLENMHDNKEPLKGSTTSELIAPVIMEEEDRTLETVIKCYEKELDALRKLAINQQENGEFSILDIIKEYEDRLDALKNEKKSLKNDLDRLADRLGNNLVEDIKKLDDDTVDGDESFDDNKQELEDTGMKKHLKAPKIMREESATLEVILKKYEDALELNVSKTGLTYEDIEKASDDPLKTINDIKRENEIFKNALGENLTQTILEAIKDNKSEDDLQHDTFMQTADGTGPGDLHERVQERKPSLTHESQDNESLMPRSENNSIAEAVPKPSPSDGLKANALMRDEGRTVENILRNYEKEIEALSKLISQETDPGYSIPDLVTSYEDKIEDLKMENKGLESRMETLAEKIGKDLTKVLESENMRKEGDDDLLRLKESYSGSNPKWKAVEKMKEGEKTLADILEMYERDLEKLLREKSAMEALVNTNESDGQSALDIISQYEDEIEHLKDTTKECENKLSTLFARIGDNLVNDILTLTPGEELHLSCSLQALQTMAMQEKELSAVLEQYEDDLSKLTRENEALRTIASKEKVDGKPVTSLVSEYEKKIQELLEEKKEAESSLCVLTKKTGESLAKEMLNPGEGDKTFSLDALKIMDNETKTLADVVEKYEDDLAKMNREINALRDLASEDPERVSIIDKISKYEDEISNLTKTIQKQALLEKNVGIDLSKQLTALGERGTEGSQCNVSLKAVVLMEKNKDVTVAEVLKDYEEELEKKNKEILTLKELISGDMLEIAASQESEIHELKKVKGILANELDLISDKVGKELVNALLKNTTQQPTTETGKLYREVAQKMENEGKPLEGVVEDYDKEIKLMLGKNNELSEMKDVLTEKIGKDLVNELLRTDAYESTKRKPKPLFEASELMSTEAKTLAEVVLSYEKELAKLKRENEALRLLTDKESSQDSSVIDVLSDYEEQIEKLEAENRELNKRMQKLTQKVGVELAEALLKLPDDVCKGMTETINELNALRILKENQTTVTDVLRNYEKKLREDDEANFGPLVSGKAMKEDIKFAQLVRVDESEPEILISKEELSDISIYLQDSALDLTPDANPVDTNPLDDQDQMKTLADTNAKLRKKLEQLSRKVGKELSQELMKSPEDKEDEMRSAVKFASVRDLEAFDDVVSERATLAQVLENYEKKLKGTLQDDVGTIGVGDIKEEAIEPAQLVRANECVEEICDIGETEAVSHYKAPENDLDQIEEEEKGTLGKELDSQPTKTKAESSGRGKQTRLDEKVKELEKALEQEKILKEKYEKDIQALLKDIVDLKMKQVEGDTENPEETKRKIQEEVNLKQDNKRLQEDLANEKKRSVLIEESKRDLLDKVDALMREKEMLLKQQNELQLVSGNEGVDETCDIDETEIVSHFPESNLNGNAEKEVDGLAVSEWSQLDLTCLEDLIPEKYQIIEHPNESLLTCPERESVQEETIKVELLKHEECLNSEFLENLFASDIGDMSKEPDSKSRETEAESGEREKMKTLEERVKKLEKELEEEKIVKEKYEKNIQDLLKDIVDLKMKQVEEDTGNPEEARKKIQEEVDIQQDNKRLQEDLRKERKRRLSIEESKRDLLDEVDALMREKELLLKQQNEPKGDEKLLEDMINLRKKIGELDTKNKNLTREVKELRQSIKELESCHDEEKSQLLENCEKEKSEMMDELMNSKKELETQLQELLGMNDDLKGTIKNLLEELKESHEKLVTEGEKEGGTEREDAEQNKGDEARVQLMDEAQDKERNAAYEKEKNENLKEQLDETESALRQTLQKYQEEITAIETEKAKREDELQQEIKIMSNKLELEKISAEQQRKDFENVLQREKERLKEDMAIEIEREKKKLKLGFEDREDELARRGKMHSADLKVQEEQWNKEREEMQEIFRIEKEKLQKAFDEELQSKIAENDEQHRQRNEQMNREFSREKKEIKATIEKKIYEKLIDKNISAETDFQEVLSKILQEHSKEIEGVENDIRKAEERFKEDKNKVIEQSDKEKVALMKAHDEEKKALESTVQNLLKEVVKLKHQRKEIRIIHKKEKESMEEIYERDRVKLKDDWEQYKRDLLSKLQDEFDNKLANETNKLETRLEDVKRELEKSEERRKELEERLRGNPHENEQQRFDEGNSTDRADVDKEEHLKELKSMKKKLEEEYEKKLKDEKKKFEETLQGLRREIGSLQEKRRFIQDKLYNQDPSVADRHLIEKSLANYKMEMLSKMEEEVAHKIAREKKPLEESIAELQLENDDLKRQRWELRNQLRRERSKLEEEFERERENMERQFLKEKEELKSRLETRIQREMNKRTVEDKVNRALSATSNESPYSSQDSPRRLRSENTTLRDDNDRLELEVRHLTSKLETLEISFQEIISSEKIKAEKMKRIQAKMPKKVTFSDDVETRTTAYTTGDHNETILQELRERDGQVRELMEAKHFYEEVLSELCEEAGLFELDQNVVI